MIMARTATTAAAERSMTLCCMVPSYASCYASWPFPWACRVRAVRQ
jgi:hypothetical protein